MSRLLMKFWDTFSLKKAKVTVFFSCLQIIDQFVALYLQMVLKYTTMQQIFL